MAGIMLTVCLSGCSLLDSAAAKLNEKLDALGGSPLIVRVLKIENGGVKASVMTADSHYDEGDEIYVYFSEVAGTGGTNKVSPRDQLTISYNYSTDVTTEGGTPVIRVEVVSLYIPQE